MKHEGPSPAALGVPLDDAQQAQLEAFAVLLTDRATDLGMIGKRDLPRLWERHLLDSLRAAVTVTDQDRTAVDLGSGAGLPGLAVAIARPELHVTLTEPRRQRIAFLELAALELGLSNVAVHGGRAEQLTATVDLCFARAFKDAAASWAVAAPRLGAGGRLVYFAGARFDPVSVPGTVAWSTITASSLAGSGPLVIMTQQ